jgi:hypothetical protein
VTALELGDVALVLGVGLSAGTVLAILVGAVWYLRRRRH